MSKHIVALVSLVVLVFTACSQNAGQDGGMRKQDVGAVAGAIGGAMAGSTLGKGKGQIATIAVGTLLGGYLGREVGASMDRADMVYYTRTSQAALESNKIGTSSTWTNPDSGHSGTITPTRTFQQANSQYCREYTQTITVGGKTQEGFGVACRQPDGTWKIQG